MPQDTIVKLTSLLPGGAVINYACPLTPLCYKLSPRIDIKCYIFNKPL